MSEANNGAPAGPAPNTELAEVIADAERLERERIGPDAATVEDAPGAEERQAEQAREQQAAEWLAVLTLARDIVGKVRADVAGCFADADLRELSKATAAVAVKYGWNVGDLFGRYKEEIGLGLALMGPGMKVAALVKEQRARAAAPAAAEEGAGK